MSRSASDTSPQRLDCALEELRGHHHGLRLVTASEDNGLAKKADLVDDFGQVIAGFGDAHVLRGVVAHETRVHTSLLVQRSGLYNSGMSSLLDAQGIALLVPGHAPAIKAGRAFAYKGGREHTKLVYFLGAETGGASEHPPPSLENWTVRDMYGHRDGWICGLCGHPIPERWVKHDSLNLSIDHITPKSFGGSNYPSNLRATHQGCNKSRRNKPAGEPFILPRSIAFHFA